MKKKVLLSLFLLALSVLMLTACADIKKQQSVEKLDQLQAKYEQRGYECSRWIDTGVTSYAESLVAASGVVLKGEITGMMEYIYRDPSTDKHMYGTVIGVTNKADAKAIGEVYVKSMEGIVTDIECTTNPYYVQIEYALTP